MHVGAEFQCLHGDSITTDDTIEVRASDNPDRLIASEPVKNASQRRWLVKKAYVDRDGDIMVERWSVRSHVDRPERPTPDATFARWLGKAGGVKPTVFFGAPTGFAGMLAHPALPKKGETALRMASSAGEALPADIGERFTKHFGVEIVDGIG